MPYFCISLHRLWQGTNQGEEGLLKRQSVYDYASTALIKNGRPHGQPLRFKSMFKGE